MTVIDINRFKHLADGESVSGQEMGYCACGRTNKPCQLHVKRQGNKLMYNCFSASCPVGGGTISVYNWDSSAREKKVKTNKVRIDFSNTTSNMPNNYKDWLNKFNIGGRTRHKYGITYDPERKRIVFPVIDIYGDVKANTARSIDKKSNCKWLHDRSLNELCYTSRTSACIVNNGERVGIIVEDPISAIVVGNLTPALALLGTQYENKLPYIKQWVEFNNIDRILVCLDLDAYVKKCVPLSLFLTKKGFCATPKRINKDLKEYKDKEIIRLIKGE